MAIVRTVSNRDRTAANSRSFSLIVRVARAPAPGQQQRGGLDAELGHVAGHHVGLRDAAHQQPHDHALRAHRHRAEQAGKDAVPVLDAGDRRADQQQDRECREQRRFEREHPRQRRAALIADEADQARGQRRREQEGDDREHLAGDAEVVGDELGAGGHEASGHLGDEQSEQSEECVDVDIAGNEAQQAPAPDRGSGTSRGRRELPSWSRSAARGPERFSTMRGSAVAYLATREFRA